MAKQRKLPAKDQVWIDAQERFRLSDVQVQMARELGLNPKKLGKLANHDQEPWKEPLPGFIESLYRKRFKRDRPDNVRSSQQMVKDKREKHAERQAQKPPERGCQQANSADSEETGEVPF